MDIAKQNDTPPAPPVLPDDCECFIGEKTKAHKNDATGLTYVVLQYVETARDSSPNTWLQEQYFGENVFVYVFSGNYRLENVLRNSGPRSEGSRRIRNLGGNI